MLSVIVELTVTFLSSIKVADYSVPALTVERVHEMMGKLKEACVSKLAELVPTKYVIVKYSFKGHADFKGVNLNLFFVFRTNVL